VAQHAPIVDERPSTTHPGDALKKRSGERADGEAAVALE
jgi:hypothetical protein